MPDLADELTYDTIRARFEWRLPEQFNMGVACSSAHDPDRKGLIAVGRDGSKRTFSFGELDQLSSRLANMLAGFGIGRGDRVGVVVPQSLETGLAHLAIWKLGAISLPLADLFGPDALKYRLSDSGAELVITTPDVVDKLRKAAPELPRLVTGSQLDRRMKESSDLFRSVETAADDPAYLIYTSGTTGPPKGALHAHRSLFGHLPGFECYYEFADAHPKGGPTWRLSHIVSPRRNERMSSGLRRTGRGSEV